jgi:hypothetical protein
MDDLERRFNGGAPPGIVGRVDAAGTVLPRGGDPW